MAAKYPLEETNVQKLEIKMEFLLYLVTYAYF